jgi:DNA primase
MPGIDYHALRQQITMREVLSLIGFRATWRQGPQLRGRCPLPGCEDRSARSFSVHLTRQIYRCFTCRAHGNALDLWAAVNGLPLYPAAITLCRALHRNPPRLPASRRPHSIPFRAPSRNR